MRINLRELPPGYARDEVIRMPVLIKLRSKALCGSDEEQSGRGAAPSGSEPPDQKKPRVATHSMPTVPGLPELVQISDSPVRHAPKDSLFPLTTPAASGAALPPPEHTIFPNETPTLDDTFGTPLWPAISAAHWPPPQWPSARAKQEAEAAEAARVVAELTASAAKFGPGGPHWGGMCPALRRSSRSGCDSRRASQGSGLDGMQGLMESADEHKDMKDDGDSANKRRCLWRAGLTEAEGSDKKDDSSGPSGSRSSRPTAASVVSANGRLIGDESG